MKFSFWCGLLLPAVLGLVLAAAPARAQTKLQVVTRTVEQSFPCRPTGMVHIQAEKANVQVQGWDKPLVKVTLRLVAKHPDRAVAERELSVLRYQLDKRGNDVYLVNYLAVPATAPPVQGNLRAEYTIWMPRAAALQAKSTYGETSLTGLTGEQTLTQEFGRVQLRSLRGSLKIESTFADVTGTDLNLALECIASKAAIQLGQAAGRYFLQNSYGTVQVEAADNLAQLSIDVVRTAVRVLVPRLEQFGYDLTASQGSIDVPTAYANSRRNSSSQSSFQFRPNRKLPLVRVKTSYADISLQATSPLIQR